MKARFVLVAALLFCTLAWQNASAQTDLGFKGAGLRLGVVAPNDVDATFGVGVFTDLGTISPLFGLEAYGNYWSQTESVLGFADATIRDIAIGGRTKYLIPVNNTKVQPFFGAGLGLHFVTAKVSMPEQDIGGFIIPATEVSDSATRLGLDLGGGMSVPMSVSTKFLSEIWYTVASDVAQFQLNVGVQYNFGS
jgi:opacity protein-like surface antigen